ncbi:MAG: two-component regulator propeller domain-containing protein, partial [Planctomycetota bacterium]
MPVRSDAAALLLAALALPGALTAQRLPVQSLGVRDGLPHARVNALLQDHKGYLWIATWEGLARHDGRRTVAYGRADGLPISLVNALAEDHRGVLWVGTHGGGIARFEDEGPQRAASRQVGVAQPRAKFTAFTIDAAREANVVSSIVTLPGRLFVATEAGVYEGTLDGDATPRFRARWLDAVPNESPLVFLAPGGAVCFADRNGVRQIDGERIVHHRQTLADGLLRATAADGNGATWIAGERSLWRFEPPGGAQPARFEPVPVDLDAGERILALAHDPAGGTWLGTTGALRRCFTQQPARLTRDNGLTDDCIRALLLDRDGALWAGTHYAGAFRLAGESIVSFAHAAPATAFHAMRIVEDGSGGTVATTAAAGMHRLTDGRFETLPGSSAPPFDAVHNRLRRGRTGDWWIGTEAGLFWCAGPDLDVRRAQRVAGPDAGERVFGEVYEDQDGAIWFSTGDAALWRIDANGRDGGGAPTA